jgi:Protein of unknown function (DUF3237)
VEASEPKLEHLFDMHGDLDSVQVVGATPQGMRQIFPLKDGWVEGPRVKGKMLVGDGDWALVRSDGAIQIDVRATVQTDDGALIYVTYGGLIVAEPTTFGRLLRGEDVALNEYYFYTNPMFQTGAPQYAWLNTLIGVGRGKVVPGGVEYRIWAVRQPLE